LKPTSAARYESILRIHLLPRWGERPVGGITPAAVDGWCAELLRGGMPPATVQKLFSTLRAALSVGVRNGYLRENPAKGIELPRPPRREMLYLDPVEVAALADAVPARYRAWILAAAYGGLRAGELWGLRRGRLDTMHGRLTVAEALVSVQGQGLVWTTPKTHEQRVLSLPPFLVAELRHHLGTYPEAGTGPEARVFSGPGGSWMAHSNFARDVFRPAVRAALPAAKQALRPHDLRHTCAALLISTGAHAKLVSTRLGHSSIAITMDRYGHLLPSLDEAATAGLEAAYWMAAASS
jgi:integrase